MNVKIMATKACSHRPNLEKELTELQVPYELVFVEDDPEAAARYAVRHSPHADRRRTGRFSRPADRA